jgi:hypothetical protein
MISRVSPLRTKVLKRTSLLSLRRTTLASDGLSNRTILLVVSAGAYAPRRRSSGRKRVRAVNFTFLRLMELAETAPTPSDTDRVKPLLNNVAVTDEERAEIVRERTSPVDPLATEEASLLAGGITQHVERGTQAM